MTNLHAVIPAGGAGTRLWPLSRSTRPKFLLDLTGSGRTLLQETWDRLVSFIPAENIHVVTGTAHADAVRDQLPGLQSVFVEPSPRDSMPAIGLAAAVIAHDHPDAVIGSFAADHYITDVAAFADAVRQAVAVALSGRVTTIGIAPRFASTAFGYIQTGSPLDVAGAPSAHRVERFVEKPDAEVAAGYFADPHFRWNAGMFVFQANELLSHLARLQPALFQGLCQIADSWKGPKRQAVLEDMWPTLPKIAIDHAVAEPLSAKGLIATIDADFGWDDIGDFAALHELREADSAAAESSDVIWVDGSGLAQSIAGRTIAVVGLDDVVVIDTGDAVLVTSLEHAQQVKQVPALLKDLGRTDLT